MLKNSKGDETSLGLTGARRRTWKRMKRLVVGWVLFIDLDGTLWDHLDVSALKPPFHRVGEGVVRDSDGVEIHLYPDMVRLIKWAKAHGAFTSTLSWNNPSHALGVLEAFNLNKLFDYHGIEPHPAKEEYAWRVLEAVRRGHGVRLEPCRIVYIDDRIIHLNGMRRRLGEIIFLQAWRDFSTFEEARDKIMERLCV